MSKFVRLMVLFLKNAYNSYSSIIYDDSLFSFFSTRRAFEIFKSKLTYWNLHLFRYDFNFIIVLQLNPSEYTDTVYTKFIAMKKFPRLNI